MKKKVAILIGILVLLIICVVYLFILIYRENTTVGPEITRNETGQDISKQEFLYKDELLELGYTISEIDSIQDKLSNVDIRNYLLTKKYDGLLSFMASPYFKTPNINRYQTYYDKNSYTYNEVVMYTEIGLDQEFYSNIEDADTERGILILVNKYYALDENYDANLVAISDELGGGKMNVDAYDHFKEMCEAAKKDNIKLKSVSAYRSYNTQKNIYNNYVKKDGQAKADTYSARPGHSEHQTGLAVDINTASSSAHFENTKEYDWLIKNSYKYGFILRYPEDKTFITGYKYEPWHYRYVGEDVASRINSENITFEEYTIKYIDN